jgi:hypothetical protein
MRKRLITPPAESIRTRGEGWLDVERAAVVEVTSEDKDFPVESAFVSGDTPGWRAAAPGTQTIRLIFDQPQRLRCISLLFEENEPPPHPGVRFAVVSRERRLTQGSCAPAVEFQPTRIDTRIGRISSGAFERYSARTGHQTQYRWRTLPRVVEKSPFVLRNGSAEHRLRGFLADNGSHASSVGLQGLGSLHDLR